MATPDRRLTAAEAASRLGVKRETLYAYVSRGVLTSARAPGLRESTFSSAEVEALAARARRGGRAGALEMVIASGLTLLQDDRHYYRGVEVAGLVPDTSFESVAEFLWTGERAVLETSPRWEWPREPLPLGEGEMDALDRLRTVVAAASAADALRYDLEPASVAAAGRRLLTAMVEGLRVIGPPPPRRLGSFALAERFWPRLSPQRPTTELIGVVNAILVLLADHDLAASTLAARVAASVRADPYSVVSTGLGVIAGTLHGAASEQVIHLFSDVGVPDRAATVVGERLRRGERIPGVGHKVYVDVDPRAEVLLELLRPLPLPAERWEVVDEVLAIVRDRLSHPVNIDFALGAFAYCTGMGPETGEILFAIARTAGWVAHAIEEYDEQPVRFRPRAAYIGPTPPASTAPASTRRARPRRR